MATSEALMYKTNLFHTHWKMSTIICRPSAHSRMLGPKLSSHHISIMMKTAPYISTKLLMHQMEDLMDISTTSPRMQVSAHQSTQHSRTDHQDQPSSTKVAQESLTKIKSTAKYRTEGHQPSIAKICKLNSNRLSRKRCQLLGKAPAAVLEEPPFSKSSQVPNLTKNDDNIYLVSLEILILDFNFN